MEQVLQQDIIYLQSVGPFRAKLLKSELNITTFRDLLYYFPYKYVDRTKFYTISELRSQLPYVQLKGRITSVNEIGEKYKKRLVANFSDGTGGISLVWFRGINWMKKSLKLNQEYLVFGKPNLFNHALTMVHPEMDILKEAKSIRTLRLHAFYHTTEKLKKHFLNSKAILKLQINMAKRLNHNIPETLPQNLVRKLKLMPLYSALYHIHFPENAEKLKLAQFRLKFDELFFIQLNILKLKHSRTQSFKGFILSKIGEHFNTFYEKFLPFKLTTAQKKVIKEIRYDLKSGKQMNRLLQGDVGSGKTMVALLTMLIAIDNGFQVCIMAPTEILANQHYTNFVGYISRLAIRVGLLKGTTTPKERDTLHAELRSGFLNILIGTHALIEENVKFHRLGLAIIDEQHRFGVAQRAKLWKKKSLYPHILVMTATPIPRTLAMTLYGDLDVSVINELPPGRKPVKTVHIYENNKHKIYKFLAEKISEGQQIYIVYPLIKESEKMDYRNLEQSYVELCEIFPSPKYSVSMIHGQLSAKEIAKEMADFLAQKTQILMATTVIEVGVDVPNATIMVIESAERFGLLQLHQLRGRVGRGTEQSYCILVSSYKLSEDSQKRLHAMVATNDGFEIAEMDLKIRGPGNIEGTQQSGIPFNLNIASLQKDEHIIRFSRKIAQEILEEDPELKTKENKVLKQQLDKQQSSTISWSVIS